MSGSKQSATANQIRSQLDRVLASESFASSQRMQEFLTYLVNESLRDGRPRLKELAIGTSVFGRDETFDPRIDSVVRVEAGRLRTKLREYYAGVGQYDPIRIDVPKGAYAPTFTPISGTSTPTGRNRYRTAGATFALVVLAGAAALFNFKDNNLGAPANKVLPYSIAVLPLKDWTGSENDYFSEAMTDVLIAALSERKELRVTSLSSVMSYKNSEFPMSQIAAELGVENIVEGTVYRDEGRVRITTNLIDVSDNRNIWSNTYNRPMTGVLALQDEVASEIAQQLVGELLPAMALSEREIDPLAYDAYLKGTYWRNRLTAEGFNRGVLFFQQAIEIQPDYAEAYAAMAACHCRLAGHGVEIVRPEFALTEATRLAKKALELNDGLAEPNAVLGIIKFKLEWDVEGSVAYLERALQQNPSLFEAHLWLSQVMEGTERQELALEHAKLAHRLNPMSLAATMNLGWQYFQAGLTEEAEFQFNQLLEFDPDFWGGHWGKGHYYLHRGLYPIAIAEFSLATDLQGGHTLPMASLGYAYAVAGEHSEALGVVDKLLEISQSSYVSPVHIAMVHAGLDDKDAAFEWLDKAFAVRARSMAWLTVRREFNSLHDDPRYAALVASIGVAKHSSD